MNRPKESKLYPGNYYCKCVPCGEHFISLKHNPVCDDCRENEPKPVKPEPAMPTEYMTPEERAKAMINGLFSGDRDRFEGLYLGDLTAAIRAAENDMAERAAGVAGNTLVREPGGWPLREPAQQEIAAAIRALKHKDPA